MSLRTREWLDVGATVAIAWTIGATGNWAVHRKAKEIAFETGRATAYCEILTPELERLDTRTAGQEEALTLCRKLAARNS